MRLIAARGTGGLAQPILAELVNAVDAAPSRELVELLQRAVGYVKGDHAC